MLEINKSLDEAVETLNEIKHADKRLKSAERELMRLRNKKVEAYKILEKENKDVEKITGVSISSFIATLMKNRMEKLEKEEMEAIEAKSRYDEICYELDALEDEIKDLRSITSKLNQAKQDYDLAFKAKKEEVMKSNPENWEKTQKLDSQLTTLNSELKELSEAIFASKAVETSLSIASKELSSAKSFGTFDILGGGLIATMAKRDHMNKAQNAINNLNYKLKTFSRELKDVNQSITSDISIDKFFAFGDYFFDGLFMDIMVQNKINDAISRVNKIEQEMTLLVSKLNHIKSIKETERSKIQNELDDLIIMN